MGHGHCIGCGYFFVVGFDLDVYTRSECVRFGYRHDGHFVVRLSKRQLSLRDRSDWGGLLMVIGMAAGKEWIVFQEEERRESCSIRSFWVSSSCLSFSFGTNFFPL